MSVNTSNYMDGVPVKISEKYKPPPKVTIPQAVLSRVASLTVDQYETSSYNYNFQLEKDVIKKLSEWQKVREVERENRRERLRRHELEKSYNMEDKQKQLLTTVSYPSTEDLSLEDERENNKKSVKAKLNDITTKLPDSNQQPQNFTAILQPTVANSPSNSNPILSPSTIFSLSKINYSDFENDTSSPFDNVELKTINDLDILAQVLHNSQKHSVVNSPVALVADTAETNNSTISDNKLTPEDSQTSVNRPVASTDSSAPEGLVQSVTTTTDSPNETSNFYYRSDVIPTNYQMLVQQMHKHDVRQQGQQHENQQPFHGLNYENINHNNTDSSAADVYFNYNNLLVNSNHNYLYRNGPHHSNQEAMVDENMKLDYLNGALVRNYCDPPYLANLLEAVSNRNNGLGVEINSRNKSKSVPDILNELKKDGDAESSEIRRVRNHSQSLGDHIKRNSADSAQLFSPQPTSTSSSSSSTSFMKLSPSSQTLAKNISSMGFPLERVAKIAELYGNDDKKIIEHLIPLGELLDFGFDETKISEALIKFDNNKDKALDFLIS